MKLADYASNVYSQYGEDGMVTEVLRRIGIEAGYCVEFGAADGLACSNTAQLWKTGWEALLIEADSTLMPRLVENTAGYEKVRTLNDFVRPGNVDGMLLNDPDVLSIDVDGNDFFIFCAMQRRAQVLIIEYNKTIPPWFDLVPTQDQKLGIGSYTLKKAAEDRGYTFLGLTKGNCIFVDTSYASKFDDLEKDLSVLQPPESFMYLATDFEGKVLPLGYSPPWGLAWPQSSTEFRPNQDGLLTISSIDPTQRLIDAAERLSYQPQQIEEIRSAAMQIALDMRGGYNEELRDRIERELGLRP